MNRLTYVRPLLAALFLAATLAVVFQAGPAAAAETYVLPTTGVFDLTGKGFGHGHGMSQYGAKGRAEAGHTLKSILDFYYPGTVAGSVTGSTLKVALTNAGKEGLTPASGGSRYQCDFAASGSVNCGLKVLPQTALAVKGLNPGVSALVLPTTVNGAAVRYWSVRPSTPAGGLQLRASTVDGLKDWGGPDQLGFMFYRTGSGSPTTRLQYLDGRQVDYRGRIEVRDTSTSRIVRLNVVSMESYLRGVVPREMPASWHQTALRVQAVAARTYAADNKENAGSIYDTCDSTSCQVYLGEDVVTTSQDETPSQSNDAVTATAGQIRTYAGQGAAFTQFSASNGGYKSTGSTPYLKAGADSFDTYPAWTDNLSAAALQIAYPSVGKLARLVITARDGHGTWGGRITGARLEGVRNGSATTVNVTGDDLRAVGGLKSTYFTVVRPVIDPHDRFGAAASAAGAADLVTRANTGAVLARAWSVADGLGPATSLGRITSYAPAGASEGGGVLDALAVGTDAKLYLARRPGPTSVWTAWSSLGGTFSGRPAAVVSSGGYLNVFARGADGAVMQRWRRPDMSWSSWTRVGGRMPASTGPAAVATGDGGLQLLVHGTDHRLWGLAWTAAAGWAPTWTPLGGRLIGDPSLVTDVTGRLTAVVRGTDDAVWALDVVGSTAGSWQRLGGVVRTSPVATTFPGSAQVDILVNDTNGRLVRRTRTADTWSTAFVSAE